MVVRSRPELSSELSAGGENKEQTVACGLFSTLVNQVQDLWTEDISEQDAEYIKHQMYLDDLNGVKSLAKDLGVIDLGIAISSKALAEDAKRRMKETREQKERRRKHKEALQVKNKAQKKRKRRRGPNATWARTMTTRKQFQPMLDAIKEDKEGEECSVIQKCLTEETVHSVDNVDSDKENRDETLGDSVHRETEKPLQGAPQPPTDDPSEIFTQDGHSEEALEGSDSEICIPRDTSQNESPPLKTQRSSFARKLFRYRRVRVSK